MKACCIPHRLALAAALALSSCAVFAASSEPRALSESEMSAVYGVALRTWAAASEATTARWTRAGAPTNMSATTTASVSLVLP